MNCWCQPVKARVYQQKERIIRQKTLEKRCLPLNLCVRSTIQTFFCNIMFPGFTCCCPSIMCASTIGSGEEGADPGEGGPCKRVKIKQQFKSQASKRDTYLWKKQANVPTWPRNSRRFFSLFISSLRLLAICSGVSTDSLNSKRGENKL